MRSTTAFTAASVAFAFTLENATFIGAVVLIIGAIVALVVLSLRVESIDQTTQEQAARLTALEEVVKPKDG